MAFDIGQLYRQLSGKIRNLTENSTSEQNNTKRNTPQKTKFLFSKFNYKPTVLKDTPEPPTPMYAVPDYTPEPTPEPATTTQPDTSQESNPFESAFTKFMKGLFK